MKKMQLMFSVLLTFITLFSVSLCSAMENEPDGIFGISWGTDIKDIESEFIFVRNYTTLYDDVKVYVKKSDDLKFESINLTKTQFVFWKDKLYLAFISTENEETQSLIQTLTDKHGEPRFVQLNGGELYAWQGINTNIYVVESRNIGTTSFSSISLSAELEQGKISKQ